MVLSSKTEPSHHECVIVSSGHGTLGWTLDRAARRALDVAVAVIVLAARVAAARR